MKTIKLLLTLTFFITLYIPSVDAQTKPCYKDGEWYKHGTRMGKLWCNDGRWERL